MGFKAAQTEKAPCETALTGLAPQQCLWRDSFVFVLEGVKRIMVGYFSARTMADDDNEVGLPQKGLNMIIKDVLPDMRIANESRELLNQCCAEFVKYLSREAQRISSNDQRKTIYHEHVQKGDSLTPTHNYR